MDVVPLGRVRVLCRPMYATRYRDIGLAAWDCRIGGLDARAAWKAVATSTRLAPGDGDLHRLLTDERLGVATTVKVLRRDRVMELAITPEESPARGGPYG